MLIKLKMTDRWLAGAIPAGDYKDTQEPDLSLRVSPKGKKTFVCRYSQTRPDGTRYKPELTLGHYDTMSLAEARDRAGRARGAADKRENPAEAVPLARVPRTLRTPPPPPTAAVVITPETRARLGFADDVAIRPRTVGHLAVRYLEEHVDPNRKDPKDKEAQIVRTYVLGSYAAVPDWRDLDVTAIDRAMVSDRVAAVATFGSPRHTTPAKTKRRTMAVRVKACISKMMTVARDELGWTTGHPVLGMKGFNLKKRDDGTPKEIRWLAQDEVLAAWDACVADEDRICASALLLQIFTGQRTSMILEAEWAEFSLVDTTKAWWTVPAGRTGNKMGLPHRVPIVGYALALLQELQAAAYHPRFVFPHTGQGGLRTGCLFDTLYDILVHAARPLPLAEFETLLRVRHDLLTQAQQRSDLRQTIVAELSRRAKQTTPVVQRTPAGWALTATPYAPVYGDGSLDMGNRLWREFTARVCRRMGFRPYDSRATMTTHLGALDVPHEYKDHLLGHKPKGVTSEHYDAHQYDKQKRATMLIWHRELQRWREPDVAAAKVVSFG
jgi:integrase